MNKSVMSIPVSQIRRKAYKPGDVIDENCEPLFKVLNFMSDERAKICDSCFQIPPSEDKDLALKSCGGCQLMTYCSKECQRTDWKNGHKLECKSRTWKKKNFDTSDKNPTEVEIRFQLFRAMAFLHLNPDAANKLYNNEFDLDGDGTELDANGNVKVSAICFNDILDLPDTIHSLKFSHILIKFAAEIRKEKLDSGQIVADAQFFTKIMRVFQTNGFPLRTPSQSLGDPCPVGMAIFVQRSIFKHSCKPTAIFCRNGTKFEIRAIAHIPGDEEPTISYLAYHPRWPVWEFSDLPTRGEQQKLLIESFGFKSECECDYCMYCADADASVDFAKLNSNIQFFKSCNDTKNYWAIYTVEEFLYKHEAIIGTMKKLFYDYDDRVTEQYLLTFAALMITFLGRKPFIYLPQVQKLLEEAKDHVSVTFGKEHSKYHGLMIGEGIAKSVEGGNENDDGEKTTVFL